MSEGFTSTRLKIERPEGIRKGQQLFNFLEWIRNTYGNTPHEQSKRMVDPFQFPDELFDKYWKEYLESTEK